MTNLDFGKIEKYRDSDEGIIEQMANIMAFSHVEFINEEIMIITAHIARIEKQLDAANRTKFGTLKKVVTEQPAETKPQELPVENAEKEAESVEPVHTETDDVVLPVMKPSKSKLKGKIKQ